MGLKNSDSARVTGSEPDMWAYGALRGRTHCRISTVTAAAIAATETVALLGSDGICWRSDLLDRHG